MKHQYQLSKYMDPTPNGGYRSVRCVFGFNSYISALLWKLLTFSFTYKIERVDVDEDLVLRMNE